MDHFPLLSEVLKFPNPKLREVAKPVSEVNESIRQGIDHMFQVMEHEEGCGLAATQIGVPLRVFVVDVVSHKGKRIGVINPEIISSSTEEMSCTEGCLSVGDFRAKVSRPKKIQVRYLTVDGETVEETWEGFPAIAFQHELDHLNGILFIDLIPRVQSERIKDQLRKQAKSPARGALHEES